MFTQPGPKICDGHNRPTPEGPPPSAIGHHFALVYMQGPFRVSHGAHPLAKHSEIFLSSRAWLAEVCPAPARAHRGRRKKGCERPPPKTVCPKIGAHLKTRCRRMLAARKDSKSRVFAALLPCLLVINLLLHRSPVRRRSELNGVTRPRVRRLWGERPFLFDALGECHPCREKQQ